MQPANLDLIMCCCQITGAHSCLDLWLCIIIFVAWLSVAILCIRLTMNVPLGRVCMFAFAQQREHIGAILSLGSRSGWKIAEFVGLGARSNTDQGRAGPRGCLNIKTPTVYFSPEWLIVVVRRMCACSCVDLVASRCQPHIFGVKAYFLKAVFEIHFSTFPRYFFLSWVLICLPICSTYKTMTTHILCTHKHYVLLLLSLLKHLQGGLTVQRSDVTEEEEIRVNSPNCYFKLSNVFLLSTRVVLQGGRFGVLYFNKGQMNTEAD